MESFTLGEPTLSTVWFDGEPIEIPFDDLGEMGLDLDQVFGPPVKDCHFCECYEPDKPSKGCHCECHE